MAIRRAYSAFLVPVRINGISGMLVLDTGASQTLIKPELARQCRRRHESLGLLGANFLHHFRFTVDRKNLQLILEPEK